MLSAIFLDEDHMDKITISHDLVLLLLLFLCQQLVLIFLKEPFQDQSGVGIKP